MKFLGLIISLFFIIINCTAQKEITRLNGSSIKDSTLTNQIEKITKDAKVTGLAIVIFNDN